MYDFALKNRVGKCLKELQIKLIFHLNEQNQHTEFQYFLFFFVQCSKKPSI